MKLENRIHDKVKKYTLGMRQRLGVAQALLHNPSLLILDEPTNGLDPAGIRELRDYLRYLTRAEGITVIVSSHLLSEMELMCDRVAVLNKGKLIDVKLIQDFIGSNNGAQTFLIEALPAEQALAAILGIEGVEDAKAAPEGLEVITERDRIPEIVAHLVRSNTQVYGVRARNQSLEDRFPGFPFFHCLRARSSWSSFSRTNRASTCCSRILICRSI
ncbi:ABC-type multidrug transport system ATPase subunit [Paenibacillus harenae]|uniref:ABC-type multidrug transport system ATPase subunit n=1 Tax=Paenibacillus harenae TaxID=306543 RepID=A0ABT9U286_PAEHA|nr:ABC-type multidrug transport system ATPase subunit [Paenibacillus harenae]